MSSCINIEGLTKQFGKHIVIKNLNLTIAEGEKIIFLGPSGIGKSTFLRCITYLAPFQKGFIQVGNMVLTPGMDETRERSLIQAVRKEVGFVFQFFNLFPHLNVLDNITIAPIKVLGVHPDKARHDALCLLKRVGLEHKATMYTNALSGGQSQRVAIARALAMRPKVLLLDEPTSSLDPAMKEEVINVIEDFAHEGLTMLIVTHETAFIERIATRIITFGPHCSILSEKNLNDK